MSPSSLLAEPSSDIGAGNTGTGTGSDAGAGDGADGSRTRASRDGHAHGDDLSYSSFLPDRHSPYYGSGGHAGSTAGRLSSSIAPIASAAIPSTSSSTLSYRRAASSSNVHLDVSGGGGDDDGNYHETNGGRDWRSSPTPPIGRPSFSSYTSNAPHHPLRPSPSDRQEKHTEGGRGRGRDVDSDIKGKPINGHAAGPTSSTSRLGSGLGSFLSELTSSFREVGIGSGLSPAVHGLAGGKGHSRNRSDTEAPPSLARSEDVAYGWSAARTTASEDRGPRPSGFGGWVREESAEVGYASESGYEGRPKGKGKERDFQGGGGPERRLGDAMRQVFVYEVQKGDSLASVALTFGIDVTTLRRANKMWPSDSIHLRKHVFIPVEECRHKPPNATITIEGTESVFVPRPPPADTPKAAEGEATRTGTGDALAESSDWQGRSLAEVGEVPPAQTTQSWVKEQDDVATGFLSTTNKAYTRSTSPAPPSHINGVTGAPGAVGSPVGHRSGEVGVDESVQGRSTHVRRGTSTTSVSASASATSTSASNIPRHVLHVERVPSSHLTYFPPHQPREQRPLRTASEDQPRTLGTQEDVLLGRGQRRARGGSVSAAVANPSSPTSPSQSSLLYSLPPPNSAPLAFLSTGPTPLSSASPSHRHHLSTPSSTTTTWTTITGAGGPSGSALPFPGAMQQDDAYSQLERAASSAYATVSRVGTKLLSEAQASLKGAASNLESGAGPGGGTRRWVGVGRSDGEEMSIDGLLGSSVGPGVPYTIRVRNRSAKSSKRAVGPTFYDGERENEDREGRWHAQRLGQQEHHELDDVRRPTASELSGSASASASASRSSSLRARAPRSRPPLRRGGDGEEEEGTVIQMDFEEDHHRPSVAGAGLGSAHSRSGSASGQVRARPSLFGGAWAGEVPGKQGDGV